MPIIGVVLGLVLLLLFGKVLLIPVKVIMKLIVNGLLGALLLFVINAVGQSFGLTLEITTINALVAGFFGLPGVIVLLLLR